MKIYLSPSVQENNRGIGDYGTEKQRMNEIADIVQRELSNRNNIELKRNTPNMNASQIINDSNSWNADYHLAFHSNAGGGKGCEIYHYVDGSENLSVKIARRVYNKVVAISPNPGRGLKNGMQLFEVNDNIKAISFLIEIGFHDNIVDANFIINEKEKIGIAIAEGVLEHLIVDRNINVDKIIESDTQNVSDNKYKVGEHITKYKVNSVYPNIREKASLTSNVVRLAKKDEILEVVAIENGFLKIKDGTYLKQKFADKL